MLMNRAEKELIKKKREEAAKEKEYHKNVKDFCSVLKRLKKAPPQQNNFYGILSSFVSIDSNGNILPQTGDYEIESRKLLQEIIREEIKTLLGNS